MPTKRLYTIFLGLALEAVGFNTSPNDIRSSGYAKRVQTATRNTSQYNLGNILY